MNVDLRNQIEAISGQLERKYDGTITNYLDANFPFIDGFPLFPHLSHSGGRKLDLAFFYKMGKNPTQEVPSLIGYGVHEDPMPGESDYPSDCKSRGYWQYGLLSSIVSQQCKDEYELDVERTKELILLLAEDKRTSKIFIAYRP